MASGLSPEGAMVGYLAVGSALPQPVRFQAAGIDTGFYTRGIVLVKNVVFQ